MKLNIVLLTIILLFMYLPLSLLAQDTIEVNVLDEFHYSYPSQIIGVAYDGEYLWMSETCSDSLIACDLSTGEEVYGFPSPLDTDIYGLAYDGENFWASSSRFLYNISHEDGSLITSFHIPYPTGSTDIVTDLAWNDDYLYCSVSAGFSSAIVVVDIETQTGIDTLGVAGAAYPGGLAYLNGYLWLHEAIGTVILKVNPEHGQYEGEFRHYHLCDLYIGMTPIGEYIYCSDGYCNIFKYEIIDNSIIGNDVRRK